MDELDDKQLEAVTYRGDSDLCVSSTVGSGKTRILTHRVQHLARIIDPAKIIAITFTQDAAKEIQERLNKLGVAVAFMGTIHGLCFKILQQSLKEGEEPYEVNEYWKPNKLRIILSKDLRVAPFYLDPILRYIAHAQANMLSHDHNGIHSFAIEYLSKPSRQLNSQEFSFDSKVSNYVNAYKLLEKERELKVLDFDDMIFLTWRALQRNPKVQEDWYKRFDHALVDEVQDNTPIQHSIVRMLSKTLTLIGDQNQAIYSFRAANPKEFLDFAASAKTVSVNYNYRSHPDILSVASKLVVGKSWHLGGAIIPKAVNVDPVEGQAFQVIPTENSTEEAKFVVESICRLHELNVPFNKIAVLYRTNNSLCELERTFAGSTLPFFVSRSTPFFKRREVRDLIAYLRVVTCQDSGDNLQRIINVPPRYIGRTTINAVVEFAKAKGIHLLDAISQFDGWTPKQKGSILQLIGVLKNTFEMFKGNVPTKELLEHIDKSVGYTRWLDNSHEELVDSDGDVNRFVQQLIYEEAPKFTSPLDFLEHVKYHETLSSKSRRKTNTEAVTLSTIHQAKGLEWDYVFVINVNSHIIPHRLAITPEEIDEELRLLYVAITRARRQCVLSYTGYYINKGQWDIGRPSSFIPKEYLESIKVFSEFAS